MSMLSHAMSLLPVLAPSILTNLIGVGVALTRLGHARRPAFLVLAGCGLLLFTSIVSPFIQSAYIEYRQAGGVSNWNSDFWMHITGFIIALMNWVGYALVLAAAFVDRPRENLDDGRVVERPEGR